jgi:hypothetical protein
VSPFPALLPATRARVGQWRIDLGYWIRPYDMLADRRHWRWQRPAPCGRVALASLTPQQRAALEAAVAERRNRP